MEKMINDLGHDFSVYLRGNRMMIENLTDKGIALDSLVCFFWGRDVYSEPK